MRIAICQKDSLMREALERLLSVEGNFDVVISAPTVEACITGAKIHEARVVILVLEQGDEQDLSGIREARQDSRFSLLGITRDVTRLEESGVFDRVLSINTSRAKVFKVVNDLGVRDLRPRYMPRQRQPIYGMATVLTPREHEIALKVAEGLANRDIARDLHLAEQTVKNMVSVVMRKMQCQNRVQVALKLAKARQPESIR